jgi:hypothetical protein
VLATTELDELLTVIGALLALLIELAALVSEDDDWGRSMAPVEAATLATELTAAAELAVLVTPDELAVTGAGALAKLPPPPPPPPQALSHRLDTNNKPYLRNVYC